VEDSRQWLFSVQPTLYGDVVSNNVTNYCQIITAVQGIF